jgi:tyrosyl-tRNA synthetase
VANVLSEAGVVDSRGKARRLIESGGAYLNNRRVADIEQTVTLDDTVEGRFVVLRRGRKNYYLVRIQ